MMPQALEYISVILTKIIMRKTIGNVELSKKAR